MVAQSTVVIPCGLCNTEVTDIPLPCGHIKNQLRCHQAQNLSAIRCNVSVRKQVLSCNRVIDVPCHRDVSSDSFSCPEPCSTIFDCGHRCQGTCGTCNIRAVEDRPATVKHRNCSKICGRRYGTCNHTCQKECHGGGDCGLCFSSCGVITFLSLFDYLCPYSPVLCSPSLMLTE